MFGMTLPSVFSMAGLSGKVRPRCSLVEPDRRKLDGLSGTYFTTGRAVVTVGNVDVDPACRDLDLIPAAAIGLRVDVPRMRRERRHLGACERSAGPVDHATAHDAERLQRDLPQVAALR